MLAHLFGTVCVVCCGVLGNVSTQLLLLCDTAVFMLPHCAAFAYEFGEPCFRGFALLRLMFRPMLGEMLLRYPRDQCFHIAFFFLYNRIRNNRAEAPENKTG